MATFSDITSYTILKSDTLAEVGAFAKLNFGRTGTRANGHRAKPKPSPNRFCRKDLP